MFHKDINQNSQKSHKGFLFSFFFLFGAFEYLPKVTNRAVKVLDLVLSKEGDEYQTENSPLQTKTFEPMNEIEELFDQILTSSV